MTQRIEPFFFLNVTQIIEPFGMWLKELNFFLNVTPRIELPFFLQKKWDSKKWTFFNLTQGMNFFQYDSKNWIWLKEFNPFFFLKMTQRIEPSLKKLLKKLNFLSEKELNLCLENKTQRFEPLFEEKLKELNLFFDNMAQRTELFLKIWLKELNSLW